MAKERVFAVFGLGAFGAEICRHLAEKGGKVIAFDNQPKLVERISDTVAQALVIDSTDEDSLANAPLEDIDVAVIGIGDDIEASILTTALLKKICIPHLIARAVSDVHTRVLKQIGADEVVNIEIEEGRQVAARLISQDILETIPISSEYSVAEIYAPETLLGKTVEVVKSKFKINIMAVKSIKTTIDSQGNPVREEVVRLPGQAESVREGNIYLIIGKNSDIEALKES